MNVRKLATCFAILFILISAMCRADSKSDCDKYAISETEFHSRFGVSDTSLILNLTYYNRGDWSGLVRLTVNKGKAYFLWIRSGADQTLSNSYSLTPFLVGGEDFLPIGTSRNLSDGFSEVSIDVDSKYVDDSKLIRLADVNFWRGFEQVYPIVKITGGCKFEVDYVTVKKVN